MQGTIEAHRPETSRNCPAEVKNGKKEYSFFHFIRQDEMMIFCFRRK